MPPHKSYRQEAGKQRHHKGRVGRMLVPHGNVSGLLFTVNPRQEKKALREVQLYLHPLIADLEKTYVEENEKEGVKKDSLQKQDEEQGGMDTNLPLDNMPSTSSLLAAELAEYIPAHHDRHDRNIRSENIEDESDTASKSENNDNNDDDGDNDDGNTTPPRKRQKPEESGTKKERIANKCRWLAPLETGCKGHLMISIPFPSQQATEETVTTTTMTMGWSEKNYVSEEPSSDQVDSPLEGSLEAEKPSGDNPPLPHSILHNPLVQTVVERIFKDIEENPRPLLRHCFRLMPCELTCCPTLPEMRAGLERLLNVYFPPKPGNQQLHRVSFSFKVKNNTNVENKKAYLQAALEAAFPANRFVLIPSTRVKSCEGGVEATFCALVVHSTCAMGTQWHFTERSEYNLHAIGESHLELSSAVSKKTP
ncbi:uncharacterized protein TM35_000421160 [Trypanosoma theileri]|uniref:THUMP domain-containing protein n=1 Tax=Trypanosoma theileri TaxID=67003 RepID=A0A1X0NJH1_9TRYP|nr:uncharacterized protein TM35_000421160 [Trypanosoma theileri]ORC84658.1 hypothetical protein TM35_000421160 [Trypanosoma theileri]